MEIEEIISQQIQAAIAALIHAKSRIASAEVNQHLNVAAAFIQDVQFNILSLQAD